ncbi:hypothetical protein AK88_00711 [Plasmodium fragile]|uniref:Tryptophan/threonine-rich plasmodium antigen C-terminal domain-containing protein n=1 Tax=Plasmodium fragile TaxID=5857 RepID=A0A0D9QRS3_PLAFR|nr:uncharacterized protein AK88_00711 [Plasmodium fragile]KJP89502.1 hypothetical protein AK88_00711 [Plasmodium fragile]
MEGAYDISKCIIDAICSPNSKQLEGVNPAVKFDGNCTYNWHVVSLCFFLVLINYIYTFLNTRSNTQSIESKPKPEDSDHDDHDDEEEDDDVPDVEHCSASDKEDNLKEKKEKEAETDKQNEKHMSEGMEQMKTPTIEPNVQKHQALLTNLEDMPEEELEEWKNQEWKKYMINVEEEWQFLNLCIEQERQNWIDSKDKELENWMKKMENKWMDIDNIGKEHQCTFIKSDLKDDDQSHLKERLKHEVKNSIYRDWKNWIRDNESYLNTWLIKQWTEWRNNKILNFLMAEWRLQEDEYWTEWEQTETWKWLQFNKRRKWLTWKNRVSNEKQEWENWVKIKEQRVIYNKYKKWTLWINAKKRSINQWVEWLADKCVNDSRWNTWIKEKYKELVLQENMERAELMKKLKNRKTHQASTFLSLNDKLESVDEA